MQIEDPKTLDERADVAGRCCEALALDMPVLVDDMQDTVGKAYHAHPDRLFVLGADGKVAFRGERGPRGFDVDALEQGLLRCLEAAQTTPAR